MGMATSPTSPPCSRSRCARASVSEAWVPQCDTRRGQSGLYHMKSVPRQAIATPELALSWNVLPEPAGSKSAYGDGSAAEAEESTGSDFEYGSNGPDDALGLYLRQMGSIPLLTRAQELALAQRLETTRKRYRRAVLFSWLTISRVVEVFQRVRQGDRKSAV